MSAQPFLIDVHDRGVRLEMARDLYRRIAGRRDLDTRTSGIHHEANAREASKQRADAFKIALDDLCRISGFSEDQLK
jgi:hypothetical protein